MLCVLIVVQTAFLGWGAWTNSPTIDEPGHLQSGLIIWQLRRFEVYAVNPPLVRMVAAIPAATASFRPYLKDAIFEPSSRWEFESGTKLFARDPIAAVFWLRVARFTLIPFVLLGLIIVWKWADSLFGTWGAVYGGFLWCFSPMILAHGSLITADVPAAAMGALAMFCFRRWLIRSEWITAVLFGIAAGAALLTKFTWLAVLPPSVTCAWLLWRGQTLRNKDVWHRDIAQLGCSFGIALLIINGCYGFDGTGQRLSEIRFVSQSLRPADISPSDALTEEVRPTNRFSSSWLGTLPIIVPRCYLQGIDVQRRDFEPGSTSESYLMGQWKVGGWWFYYLVAALVKEPLVVLVLSISCVAIFALAVLTRRYKSLFVSLQDTNRASPALTGRCLGEVALVLLPPVLIFILVSSHTGFNHHYRYIIPAHPFVFVVLSGAGAMMARFRYLHILFVGLMSSSTVLVSVAGPHWLGYFNSIGGGSSNGDYWLSDSNIDWGQDLFRLRSWHRQNSGNMPLYIAAFTFVSPRDLGIDCTPAIPDAIARSTIDAGNSAIEWRPGWYAVSTCVRQGRRWTSFDNQGRAFIRRGGELQAFADKVPSARIGTSICIYHLPHPIAVDGPEKPK